MAQNAGVLRVHLLDDPAPEFSAALRDHLDGVAEVGEGPVPPGETEILVAGRPTAEMLDEPSLRVVVIPFAGVPEATAELVSSRPRLKLYNLHHNSAPTAEMALALLLAAVRFLVPADRELRQGRWMGREGEDRQYVLDGKAACILGYGAIGKRIGVALEAMGMAVRGIGRYNLNELDEALSASHALVAAAPLTPETRGLIDARRLALLRDPRMVVNVGRGAVIDEEALYEGCRSGEIAVAGIDVWYQYPGEEPVFPSRFPFEELDNVVMSPHRGGAGDVAEERRAQALANLVRAIASGNPPPAVDPALGY